MGAKHYRKTEARGERLPVAVALGPEPAVIYAATTHISEDVNEFILAGFLKGSPMELVPYLTVPLQVPAQ